MNSFKHHVNLNYIYSAVHNHKTYDDLFIFLIFLGGGGVFVSLQNNIIVHCIQTVVFYIILRILESWYTYYVFIQYTSKVMQNYGLIGLRLTPCICGVKRRRVIDSFGVFLGYDCFQGVFCGVVFALYIIFSLFLRMYCEIVLCYIIL